MVIIHVNNIKPLIEINDCEIRCTVIHHKGNHTKTNGNKGKRVIIWDTPNHKKNDNNLAIINFLIPEAKD